MKKAFYLFAFAIAITLASSVSAQEVPQFNVSLKYGSTNKVEVMKLQNFLVLEGFLKVAPTGNFFTLTQQAVIEFQKANAVVPASGYFGPLTRAVANQKMLAMVGGSLVAEVSADSIRNEAYGVANTISSEIKTVSWRTINYPINAGININLLRKISDSPASWEFIRTLATDTPNDNQESWLPLAGEDTGNVYVEVTCSNTYKYKAGCKLGGAPIKVD